MDAWEANQVVKGFSLVMLTVFVVWGCDSQSSHNGEPQESQSQSQTVTIGSDSLASVSGKLEIRFGSGAKVAKMSPAELVAEKTLTCSIADWNKCGSSTTAAKEAPCTDKWWMCEGHFLPKSVPSFRVRFAYQGSASMKSACDDSPVCQHKGELPVDPDGSFSISNLLVGTYSLEAYNSSVSYKQSQLTTKWWITSDTHWKTGCKTSACCEGLGGTLRSITREMSLGQGSKVTVYWEQTKAESWKGSTYSSPYDEPLTCL